jgi:toxin ParE1/3/4
MDFKLIWSDGALADVDRLCAYIAKQNATAAYDVARGIFAHVKILSSFPLIGPTYPRGARGPLREIVFRNYRIFYDVDEEVRRVDILHVRHAAQDEPMF